MRYTVTHITDYIYEVQASLCHNLLFQIPKDLDFQKVENFNHSIFPGPNCLAERKDFFDNNYIYFSVEKTHKKLTVVAQCTVELWSPNWMQIAASSTQPWEEIVNVLHSTETANDVRQYYLESEHIAFIPGAKEYTLQSFTPNRPIMEAMLELNTRIFNDFAFTPGFTDISTPLTKVFESRKGVCQDFAHFSLACLRSIGLAARYVSGYIETLPPPGKPKMVGADASHAWIAMYIPGLDWVEFDATNNLLVDDKHIRIAVGRDFADVTPMKGIVYSVGKQNMKVSVDVRRLD